MDFNNLRFNVGKSAGGEGGSLISFLHTTDVINLSGDISLHYTLGA
jgi:hypothetical protein